MESQEHNIEMNEETTIIVPSFVLSSCNLVLTSLSSDKFCIVTQTDPKTGEGYLTCLTD